VTFARKGRRVRRWRTTISAPKINPPLEIRRPRYGVAWSDLRVDTVNLEARSHQSGADLGIYHCQFSDSNFQRRVGLRWLAFSV